MTAPEVAAGRLAAVCALGAVLGLCYDLLRPLRPRHTHFADGLFTILMLWALLLLGFGVYALVIVNAISGLLTIMIKLIIINKKTASNTVF